MDLTIKQTKALDYLEDSITTELLFGGGAGGGKSALGCYWQIKNRLKYPGTRGLIGRSKLKTLKETTLKTFFDVIKIQNIPSEAFNYNAQNNHISFFNGSEIFLKDLFFYPSDPEFDELGSLEITDAFIDEASQITLKAKNIVKSRIRYRLDEYGLLPKMLMTTNPTRNFIFDQFYKPYIDGELPEHRQFIQSLYGDNIFLSKTYADSLDSLDETSRKRLKLGDWNYLDDPAILVDYDAVDDLFTNDHVQEKGIKHLGADLAMQGRDKFIAMTEQGGAIRVRTEKPKSDGRDIELTLKGIMFEDGIGHSNTVADSDGLGSYLESYIKNIKTFHGNSRAFRNEYNNIKSECGFKLAEVINKREIKIICNEEQKERIKREILNCLKRDNIDADDSKKKLISKDKMKETLGHSPDYFDVLLMLMIFRIKKSYF